MAQRFYNNAYGVLAGPVIPEGDVIVLSNHSGFPTLLSAGDWFSLTVLAETSRYGSNIEIMKVTGVRVAGDNLELTVLRGQDGTQALAHVTGEKAEARITRMCLESLLADAMAHANARIQGLTDSAPESLDTLKELADALNNDPNFAASVTNELSKKLNTASYTAADVRTKLLTVDGAGSGLDADMLDGKQLSVIENDRNTRIASDISTHAASAAHDSRYYTKAQFSSEMEPNTPMMRNASGDVWARLFRSSFTTPNANIGVIYTSTAAGTDYLRPSTPAQVKLALSITNSDVGLGNVQNVDQRNASNLSSGTVPIARISSTSSRTSTSTAILLDAKGMNDHRLSGDHDSRYVNKAGDTVTGMLSLNNGLSFSGTSTDVATGTGMFRFAASTSTQLRNVIGGNAIGVMDSTSNGDYTFLVLDGLGNSLFRVRPRNTSSASALRVDYFSDNTTTSSPNVYATGAGNFYRSTSSIKYKKDVEDAEVGHYRKVLDLRPVFYRSKGTHDEDLGWGYWGFIAEEVAEIDPRLVHWDTPDAEDEWADKTPEERIAVAKPNGMQYERVAVLLQAVVKDHDKELVALREEVASLKVLVHELLQ